MSWLGADLLNSGYGVALVFALGALFGGFCGRRRERNRQQREQLRSAPGLRFPRETASILQFPGTGSGAMKAPHA